MLFDLMRKAGGRTAALTNAQLRRRVLTGCLLSRFGPKDRTRQVLAAIGGAERDRTVDLLIANEALSQLSYSPTVTEGADHRGEA